MKNFTEDYGSQEYDRNDDDETLDDEMTEKVDMSALQQQMQTVLSRLNMLSVTSLLQGLGIVVMAAGMIVTAANNIYQAKDQHEHDMKVMDMIGDQRDQLNKALDGMNEANARAERERKRGDRGWEHAIDLENQLNAARDDLKKLKDERKK